MTRFCAIALLSGLAAFSASLVPAQAGTYQVTTLVASSANIPGFGSPQITDSTFVNPWGMSLSSNSPLWLSVEKTGVANLYSGFTSSHPQLTQAGLVVNVPPAGLLTGPTGQVFNTTNTPGNTTAFSVSNGATTAPALFIFAQKNGTVTGWNPGVNANTALPIVGLTPPAGASYTGLGLTSGTGGSLFAANNAGTGSIDRFSQNGTTTSFTYNITLPGTTTNLVPFNVQQLGNGLLYATFDSPGKYAGGVGSGGAVAIIDPTTGAILNSFVSPDGGVLNGPWGLALAPANFGAFSNDLLVGNFDATTAAGTGGVIDAFDPKTLTFLGTLNNADGTPIQIPGLWGLQFGNGTAGSANTLFATGGGAGENEGVLAALTPAPEPGSLSLFVLGGFGFLVLRRRHPRQAPQT
jgi:uncharacterized protein (TIGR03118 family)